jgi:adenosylcobinamide-GDP ribazoletransferase
VYVMHLLTQFFRQFLGAVSFYTIPPVPLQWRPIYIGIARWCPAIGLLLGGFLSALRLGLLRVGMPQLVASALVVGAWIYLTGGLHLDGAMDTADGLAGSRDQERRLQIMADSHTGAFGVMAAVILVLLKTAALATIAQPWAIITAATWGRMGQLLAIACYPYLKPTGKGALHRANLKLPWDLGFGAIWVLGWTCWQVSHEPPYHWLGWATSAVSLSLAWGVGYWQYRQLGGHTGDTYGATVEWTEALLLCYLTLR